MGLGQIDVDAESVFDEEEGLKVQICRVRRLELGDEIEIAFRTSLIA